jgi:transcriptional regulator NrdR family protein
MHCENPNCKGSRLVVLESRPSQQGTRRRRYMCPDCLGRYYSVERIIRRPDFPQPTPNS